MKYNDILNLPLITTKIDSYLFLRQDCLEFVTCKQKEKKFFDYIEIDMFFFNFC